MDPNGNNAGGEFVHAPNGEQAGFAAPQPNADGQPSAAPQQGTPGMTPADSTMAPPISQNTGLPPLPPMPHHPQPGEDQNYTNGTPGVADDTDLIEKEWVSKAKSIVEKTRHDPFTQNREMSRLKADYLQKRYGKQLKLDE